LFEIDFASSRALKLVLRRSEKGRLRIDGASATHVADDFNEAAKFLTMAIDRFRNEKAHTSDANIDDPVRAAEHLSMSSLAMRLLDNPAGEPTRSESRIGLR